MSLATPLRPTATQNVAFTAASAQSTATASSTIIVRLAATQDCYVAFGTNPTAAVGAMLIKAGTVDYFKSYPGEKIAAISAGTDGILNIAEMSA